MTVAVVQDASREAAERGPILIAEDDPLQRRALGRLLRAWGYSVVEAADGVEALDRVREVGDRLGLVLLDIMMPTLDGIAVARHLHSDRPEIPVVACSAAMDTGVEASLKAVGVDDFLSKPYPAETLREIIRRRTRTTFRSEAS